GRRVRAVRAGLLLRSLAHVQAGKAWCGREDSNFHEVTPTSTSSLRVYHSATTAPGSGRRRGIADVSIRFNDLNHVPRWHIPPWPARVAYRRCLDRIPRRP